MKKLRHGNVIMVFVTEDFLSDKQVKLEARSVRTNSIKEPYWRKHDNADAPLRKKLDLKP